LLVSTSIAGAVFDLAVRDAGVIFLDEGHRFVIAGREVSDVQIDALGIGEREFDGLNLWV